MKVSYSDRKQMEDNAGEKTNEGRKESNEIDLDAMIEEKARYGRNIGCESRNASGMSLFSIEEKRERLYKPGGFFDENPYRGKKPLVGKVVLD